LDDPSRIEKLESSAIWLAQSSWLQPEERGKPPRANFSARPNDSIRIDINNDKLGKLRASLRIILSLTKESTLRVPILFLTALPQVFARGQKQIG
jgi:hypothetical protein